MVLTFVILEYKNSFNYESKTGINTNSNLKKKGRNINWIKLSYGANVSKNYQNYIEKYICIHKHVLYKLFRNFSLKFPDTYIKATIRFLSCAKIGCKFLNNLLLNKKRQIKYLMFISNFKDLIQFFKSFC